MTTAPSLAPDQVAGRLPELHVIDVRTPGEYAAGHVPGALNIPLDRLRQALPALRLGTGEVLLVCASGARAASAHTVLAGEGVPAAVLAGGTDGWVASGRDLEHPVDAGRGVWAMERQVRLAAGSIVLTGLALGRTRPAWRLLSAGVACGLVYSALSNTCGMAAVLAKLPHNRPRPADLDAALAQLTRPHPAGPAD